MPRKLRGKLPEQMEKRLKFFLFGPTNVGKSTLLAHFPNSYYIDTENGVDEYVDLLKQGNSSLFQTSSIDEVNDELDLLIQTKHSYRNLIIDPVTILYQDAQEKWTSVFEKYAKTDEAKETQEFGMRYWPKVKSDLKKLQRRLLRVDMNVIVTAHQKDVYGTNFSKIGVSFDSAKGDDYFYDLIFRLGRTDGMLQFHKVKERGLYEKNKFPEQFEVNFKDAYNEFADLYGRDIIEREAIPIKIASQQQIDRANTLISVLNITPDTLNRWFTKINVGSVDEMSVDECNKLIEFMEQKVKTNGE